MRERVRPLDRYFVACWPWPSYFSPAEKLKGIRLDISRWKRPSAETEPVHAKAAGLYTDFAYRPDDILLFGRESAGVPDRVHETAEGRVLIPMVEGQRSINVALSAAMICGEALRQTGFS